MGEFYTKGNEYFDNQDYAKAYELFVIGDKEGDIYCTYKIAVHLANGYAVEKDEERAKEMFARIFPALNEKANAGDVLAQSMLEEAIYWFEKVAEEGDKDAKFRLGVIYEDEIKDYEKAVYWFEKAAEDGNREAKQKLISLYGNMQNKEKSMYWYEKWAEDGDGKTQSMLAFEYLHFYDVADYKKALYWYKKAAKQEDADSQRYLGECYLRGSGGVRRNVEKANFWFKKALENYEKEAQNGSDLAMRAMAEMIKNGEGCEPDIEKAKIWYKKYIDFITPRAENGDRYCQYRLGFAYKNGYPYAEQSFEKAKYWLSKSNEQGVCPAKSVLAELYKNGNGGERDIQKAISLYQEIENFWAIGNIYEYGIGVDIDFEKAEFWYKKMEKAEQTLGAIYLSFLYLKSKRKDKYEQSIKFLENAIENPIYVANIQGGLVKYYSDGFAEIKNDRKLRNFSRKVFEANKKVNIRNLGPYYFYGIGTSKNYKKAFKELLKEQYNGYYQYLIGQCYMQGKGVEKNTALAIEWYEKAANQGKEEAILALGELYYFGQGVEQNYEKAIELFERSAEVTSYAAPYYYLGDCYHHGLGVKADWQKAKRYYEKAIKLGYSCEYALEMVKIDLGEFKRITEMETYAKGVAKLGLLGDELKDRISKDLKKDFGECWDYLNNNVKIALTTGVLTYISFVSMGEEFCKQLDFSAVIVNFAKSLETELAEFFYKGYITYLKKKKISPSVFPEDSCLLKITKKGNEEIGREYQDENETKNFRLGGLRYIIDDKFEILPSLEDAIQSEHYVKGRSEAYRNYRFKGSYGLRTIDKHMAAYANELFSGSAFSSSNRKKEIVNYLIDLANSVGEIAYQYRNPAAHGDIMAMQKASACGDYLIKVRKLIYGFLSKIKDKYKNGYN